MRPYRRLSGVLALLVIALLANLSWVQVLDADTIRQRQGNTRVLLEQYHKPRGPILVESEPIASSSRAAADSFYQRSYTEGPVFAAATGFYSLLYGARGIERAENGVLSGNDPRLFVDRIQQLFAGRMQAGGAVSLTLDATAQRAAYAAMREHRGAVVALDARTGAILVLVSTPSFDPQLLAPNDPSRVRVEYNRLSAAPGQPMVNRALERLYEPGTPFGVITLAAALSSGRFSATSPLPGPAAFTVPGTDVEVRNPDGKACGSNGRVLLVNLLATHCDTALAWLGSELGADALRSAAEQFGFEASIGSPLAATASRVPETAQATAALGTDGVRASALQLAVIAAAVANRGTAMRPYLVQDLRGPDLAVLDRTNASAIGTPMSAATAATLARALRAAAEDPGCPNCRVPGLTVHAVTSFSTSGASVVLAYAGPVALAVVVEPGTSASSARTAAVSAAMAVLGSARPVA